MRAARGSLTWIQAPEDLKTLPSAALPRLAQEIRERLIEVVPRTGGHLGPNLGVVELTIAVHRVFDAPSDAVLWDTGHQAYVHKMLTGRAAQLDSLRSAGGLSGYPCRAESPFDLVENSHASTALSYADGMARAFELTGQNRQVVAVVGDGAWTGGMAWEALNNIGASNRKVVLVLNDNGRSYEPTVGSFAAHLADLRSGDATSNLLRAMGLGYLGVVDGHDLSALEDALHRARAMPGPVVVHVATTKGKGYPPAETEPHDRMHTVSPAPKDTTASGVSWTQTFGAALLAIGEEHAHVVAVTAAMRQPTGLGAFAERFPHRTMDVGIAEQHAVTCAAGMAMAGLHPVVAIYSTFVGRAFDQLLMDVALHHLPVTLVLDRAGITGPDGASHHGMWDVSLLSGIPGMRIAAPRDGVQLRELLAEAVAHDGPTALRFPRGTVPGGICAHRRSGPVDVLTPPRPNAEVLIVSTGPMASVALEAAAQLQGFGIRTTVVDPRWIHPIAPELLAHIAGHHLVVTLEDNTVGAGLGAALSVAVHRCGLPQRVLCMGLPTDFLPVGNRSDLLSRYGLTADGVVQTVRSAGCQTNQELTTTAGRVADTPIRRSATSVSN